MTTTTVTLTSGQSYTVTSFEKTYLDHWTEHIVLNDTVIGTVWLPEEDELLDGEDLLYVWGDWDRDNVGEEATREAAITRIVELATR